MHNSDFETDVKKMCATGKRKQWKRILYAGLFLLCVVLLNEAVGFALLPVTFARMNLHNLEQGGYDDLFIGTSRGANNINPAVVDEVTGRKSTNLCMGNVYPLDDLYLIREACRIDPPKRVIYELDPSYYTVEEFQGMADPFVLHEMSFSSVKVRYAADKYLDDDFRILLHQWMFYRNHLSQAPEIMKMKLSEAYRNYDPALVSDAQTIYRGEGFLARQRPEEETVRAESWLNWNEEAVKKDREEDLIEMIRYCKEQDIEFVAVILPAPEETRTANPEGYEASGQYYEELLKKQGVPLIDFNENGAFTADLEKYYDMEGHMYEDGANEFSRILGEYLSLSRNM